MTESPRGVNKEKLGEIRGDLVQDRMIYSAQRDALESFHRLFTVAIPDWFKLIFVGIFSDRFVSRPADRPIPHTLTESSRSKYGKRVVVDQERALGWKFLLMTQSS